MAVRQPYRGNPEQKLYTLYNNFAGGMNTTDVDEAVYTHQFRLLENVELSEKGTVKNRNGFAEAVILNDLLLSAGIQLPYEELRIMQVLRDTNRFFDSYTNYNSLTEVLSAVSTDSEIKILFVGSTNNNLTVDVYKINHTKQTNAFTHDVDTYDLFVGFNRPKRLTSMDIVHYGESVYIPIGALNSTVSGILEVDYSDGTTFRLIGEANYYSPDAYEISNIGFNVLAPDPINAIAPASTSVQSIRTFWLTEIKNKVVHEDSENFKNPIYMIPQDEDFMVNVLYTGTLEVNDLTIDLYTEDIDGSKHYLRPLGNDKVIWSRKDPGVFRYRVKASIEQNVPVFVDVKKVIKSNPEYIETYPSVQAMLDDFLDRKPHYVLDEVTQTYTIYKPSATRYGYIIPSVSGFTQEYAPEWKFATDKNAAQERYSKLPESKKYVVRSSDVTPWPDVNDVAPGSMIFYWDADTGEENYLEIFQQPTDVVPSTSLSGVVDVNDATKYPNYKGQWKPRLNLSTGKVDTWVKIGTIGGVSPKSISTAEVVANIEAGAKPSPKPSAIYRIGDGESEYSYYQYIGTSFGDASDFSLIELAEEYDVIELQYINRYDVGTEQGLKNMSGLDTSNVKVLEMNGRMVIYEGNTIWFSDLYKFDYVPNSNYIVLPLQGDDEITKIAYFRGSYIIFTKETIYRMSGEFGSAEFVVTLINDSIGCIASNSVRSVNNTLIFLSAVGLFALKQNYYMEGLENVERVDVQVRNLVPAKRDVESITYDNQLWYLVKGNRGELLYTVKQYYDMQLSRNVFSTTVDRYAENPDNLLKVGFNLLSYKRGKFFQYGTGYTDFAESGMEEWEFRDKMYTMKVKTPEYNLGYPTHIKKIKNMFIKTYSTKNTKIGVTVYVDGREIVNPSEFHVIWNANGELEYSSNVTHNLQTSHAALGMVGSSTEPVRNVELDYMGLLWSPDYGETESVEPIYDLTDFTLGEHALGVQNHQTHKLVVGGKGKTISFLIEQTTDTPFSIQDIGVLHKLGKVKEG